MYSPSIVHCIVRAPIFRKIMRLNLSSTHGIANISGLCRIRKTDFRKCRQLHDEASLKECMCYSLPHRTLLKVQGQDTGSFLQGLVTNDMNLLTEAEKTALYAHMLNVQGRTLFDIIIYSLKEKQDAETGVLLECDSTVEDSVLKHLKVYKLRRRVTISRCPELALWAVLPQDTEEIHGVAIPGLRDPEKVLAWAADPRTTAMGWRLVADKCASPVELIKASRQGETEDYHKHRYAIGLPEGVKDLPPGVALPLESNLVYMQGISFTKGCYLGQELTARTHHTGVVRKRLMPVQLSAPAGASADGAPLLTPSGKPAGKLRVSLGVRGLGLVRLAHAKELLLLRPTGGADVPLEASVPTWWSQDGKKN